jgi:hypothetical protein
MQEILRVQLNAAWYIHPDYTQLNRLLHYHYATLTSDQQPHVFDLVSQSDSSSTIYRWISDDKFIVAECSV